MNVGTVDDKCDNCKHYEWYYERCWKWDCEIDARGIHNCFEREETPVKDAMVKGGKVTKQGEEYV